MRSDFNALMESDPSLSAINSTMRQMQLPFCDNSDDDAAADHQDTCRRGGNVAVGSDFSAAALGSSGIGSALIGFGAAAGGDVSLTLGLRHAGPEKNSGANSASFSVRDFGS